MKFSCEKCRKKFKEATVLEYHRITFHATLNTGPTRTTPERDKNAIMKNLEADFATGHLYLFLGIIISLKQIVAV